MACVFDEITFSWTTHADVSESLVTFPKNKNLDQRLLNWLAVLYIYSCLLCTVRPITCSGMYVLRGVTSNNDLYFFFVIVLSYFVHFVNFDLLSWNNERVTRLLYRWISFANAYNLREFSLFQRCLFDNFSFIFDMLESTGLNALMLVSPSSEEFLNDSMYLIFQKVYWKMWTRKLSFAMNIWNKIMFIFIFFKN